MFGQQSSQLATSAGLASAPLRESEMSKAMMQQGSTLIELESAVSQLYNRLSHVTRQEPSTQSENAKSPSNLPPLVAGINENTQRIANMVYALNRLSDLLEI